MFSVQLLPIPPQSPLKSYPLGKTLEKLAVARLLAFDCQGSQDVNSGVVCTDLLGGISFSPQTPVDQDESAVLDLADGVICG